MVNFQTAHLFSSKAAARETSLLQGHVDEAAPNRVGQRIQMNKATYNMAERMFGMEKGGCAAAAAAAATQAGKDDKVKPTTQAKTAAEEVEAEAAANLPPPDTSKTGQAPWQEGVLERLREELSPQEYNMYVVHHGRMLVSFGQIKACTPREEDFVYGSLEPIPVQTLCSFKVRVHVVERRSLPTKVHVCLRGMSGCLFAGPRQLPLQAEASSLRHGGASAK